MQREDFSVKATSDGYRILYKGRSIGGVGENPQQRSRARITAHRQADLIEHREAAKREIESLLAGFGTPYYVFTIREIDREEELSA